MPTPYLDIAVISVFALPQVQLFRFLIQFAKVIKIMISCFELSFFDFGVESVNNLISNAHYVFLRQQGIIRLK